MGLMVAGINHKTASLKVRERFSFTRKRIAESLIEIKNSNLLSGAVILSTCNRTEIYLDREDSPDLESVKAFIFSIFCAEKNEIERYFYILKDADAIRHIWRVASGLDSQVLGETQILTQVASAWVIAQDAGVTTDGLNHIFKKALEVGRIVRSETKVSQGNISIGSVAIKMLESRFSCLQEYSVLIIGAGKIGSLMSKYLREKRIKGIFVASRTYAKAWELAVNSNGRAVDFNRLGEELSGVDIIISSTSSPHIILKKDMLIEAMQNRKRPLFIMDLALPRDVDPRARDINGISLYDLDDLKYIAGENHKKRQAEAVFAEKIIQRELDRCLLTEYSKSPF